MHETRRAFIYLLLKERVANDVINVSLFAYDKITLKLKMLTKEDKTLIKMSGNQQSTGWNDSLRNFQTRNGASVVLRTFRNDCEQRGPLNEHPIVDVCARRALLRRLMLWGTWYRARRINPRHTAPLDRSHESSEYLKQITGYDFFCSLLLWT